MQAENIIDRGSIAQTERLIRPHIRRTPIIEVDAADFGLAAARLTFKLELLQHAGSFKTRGAFANLLTREIPPAGVVAASGGNHGAAVAYASMKLGIPAKIFVPSISSPAKVRRIRNYRAELGVTGDRYADALAASEVWAKQAHNETESRASTIRPGPVPAVPCARTPGHGRKRVHRIIRLLPAPVGRKRRGNLD